MFDTELISNDNNLKEIHESNRKYANSFSKMPKSLRLNVPNIITIFIKEGSFSEALISWSQEQTRTITGGEFHSVFLLNCKDMTFYAQGKSKIHVPRMSDIEFKRIDPQNRGYYLIEMISYYLDQKYSSAE